MTGRRHRQVVADPFDCADNIVIVVAEDRGTVKDCYVLQRLEFGHGLGGPFAAGFAADGKVFPVERTAGQRVFVDQDDAGIGRGCGERGGETGRTGTDDQNVAVLVTLFVGIRIGLGRRGSETRRAANHVFVDVSPERRRPHECLVVKTGRQQRRKQVVDRHDVETERRPAILAFGNQAVEQLDRGRARVGLLARPAAQFDDRVGLLRTGGQDAARPMVLEAAPDQVHAVGEQRRGQRVALVSLVGFAVEGETDRVVAIDMTATDGAKLLRHVDQPSPLPSGRFGEAGPVLKIS